MQPDFKRFATTLSALLAASVTAGAQDISTSLPLTSVGDRLMWTVGDQDLILDVPLAGPVRLELYSPRLDPADYRADTYYGDEQYDAGRRDLSTTFSVLREDGSTLLQRSFTPGAHDWSTLLDQDLPAGRYHLRAATSGNGKNTFAIRLAGVSAEVRADQLSVNVHSREWVAAVNVSTDGRAHVLRLYDGDGPQELQARLRDAQGNLTLLPVSADLSATDLPLPATPGNYTVELRQPAGARQFSNTVGFSLIRAGEPTPITIARVDQTGLLAVRAELVLPGGSRPTRAQVTVGPTPLNVDGQLEQRVAAGTYPVTAAPVLGAQVSVSGPVTVARGGRGEVLVQVSPSVDLTLSADKQDVCQGDTVTLRAQATTAFMGDLPMDLAMDIAGRGDTPVRTGTLSATTPGELTVTTTAQQPGPLTVTARLAPWGIERQVQLNVLPERTALQLQREMPQSASVGDEVTVTLQLSNTGSEPQEYVLEEQLPAGLQALDPTSFSGTLAPGETRPLTYRAAVQQPGLLTATAQLLSGTCQATQISAGTLSAQTPTPAPAPAPQPLRASSVSLPFDAPSQASEIVIAHAPPAGAQYVPGSARLNGAALGDPRTGPSGTLYWTLPGPAQRGGAALRGALTYDLSHAGPLAELPAPALLVRFKGDRSEVLQGKLDDADLRAARASGQQVTLTENPGAIKFPLQGSLIRIRDRISVTVEVPLEGPVNLLVNGQPVGEDRIGETTIDSGLGIRRLTFIGVPLKPGTNTLQLGSDTVDVQLVGATARIEVTPVTLTADGATPLRLKVRTLDASGNLTSQDSVTLRSNLDPIQKGAGNATGTYTLPLTGGEGELVLQPQSTPITLTLQLLQGQDVQTYTFDVTPGSSRVGVGLISATLGLDGNLNLADDLTWSARASYEGPLAGGKLYVAADKDGLPTEPDPLRRFVTLGDASSHSSPLQGLDPVAARYDHPSFRAEYRRSGLPIDVLPVGEQLTALTVTSKSNPQVSGFVALVPEDRVTEQLTPERTRLLRLTRSDIAPGSETLIVTTLERDTGKVLKQVTLQRGADYLLDHRTGIVTLARALDDLDPDGNDIRVQATYRINDPLDQRRLAFGAQVKYQTERVSVGLAAVSLDGTVTTGARASYASGATRADGLLAYSGGFQASGDFSTRVGRSAIQARIRYQDGQYHGLAPLTPGLNVSASVSTQHTTQLSSSVQAEYHRTLTDTQGGSVTARADYRAAPFSVGGGLKYAYGDQYGLGAVLSAGYHKAPLDVDVTHTQPLAGAAGGNLDPITTVSTRYAVTDAVTLGLTDEINWKTGQRATLTLDTRLGSTNYQVAYDLPTASGQGNRARFGVTTSVPLSRDLTAGVRASAVYAISARTPELGAGVDLNYKTQSVSATLGTDATYGNRGFGVVLRGGVSGSLTEHLTLTGDGLVEFGAGKNGQRVALGFAYRDRTFNALGSVRYVNGTLAGTQPELSSNLAAEYRQPSWAVRAALDTRTLLNDPGSFTAQATLSGTYYVTDRVGLGAWGRVLAQPGSQDTQFGYGLEASYRALPGTWITAGYNPRGFEGLGRPDTRQGAYLRLDLTLDESLGR